MERPPPERIRSQLDRIESSRRFAAAGHMRRFLRFVVEETLAGREDRLKEYVIGVVFLLAVGGTMVGLAQQAPSPADNDAPVLLRGVVASAADPQRRLRGARLTLVRHGAPSESVSSDADGRIQMAVPVSGPFTLTVAKAGYAPGQFAFDAAPAEPLQLLLRPGGVLTGRVVDAQGDPVVTVGIRARWLPDPAASTLTDIRDLRTETDDRGLFRIGSLPAGRYEVTLEGAPCVSATSLPCNVESVGRAARMGAATLVDVTSGEAHWIDLIDESPDAGPSSSAAPAAATGVIAGRIVTTDGLPIARAQLSARPDWTSRASTMVMSDGAGRYELAGLEAGRYRILASKAGFHNGEYGRARLRATGEFVAVHAGQRLTGVDVTLARASVIAGTIVDGYGEPLEGITIHAWERRFSDGHPIATRLTSARSSRTNDLGQYRLHGLLPGAYYVVAVDDTAVPAAAPEAQATGGGVLGQAMQLVLRGIDLWNQPHVVYPGAGGDAWPVQMAVGVDAFGIDLVFAPVRGVRVYGVLVDAAGLAAEGLPLQLRRQGPPGTTVLDVRPAVSGPQGTFEFLNATPGEYVIEDVRMDGLPAVRRESAAQPVTVGTSDVGPLIVRMSAGSSVAGTIVLEGGDGAVRPSAFEVRTLSENADVTFSLGALEFAAADAGTPVRILDDWSFESGAIHGATRFGLRRAPPGWWLKSVMIDGVDAAEHAVRFGTAAESRHDVRIVLSRTAPELSGRTIDDRGAAVAGIAVIVFPADAARWRGWPYHVRLARTGTEGGFVLPTLPPGEYWVVAVAGLDEEIESGEWQTPDLLGRLVPGARRVRLEEAQRVAMELRITQVW